MKEVYTVGTPLSEMAEKAVYTVGRLLSENAEKEVYTVGPLYLKWQRKRFIH